MRLRAADAGAAAASCLLQVVELNWSNQPYQIVHGTRITLLNNTFVSQGQPFPPAAQVNAGGGGRGVGVDTRLF